MAVNSKSSFLRGSERSLRLAVGLLMKTFLQNLKRLQDQPEFPHIWNRILQVILLPPLYSFNVNFRKLPSHAYVVVLQLMALSVTCQGSSRSCGDMLRAG